MCDCNIKMDQGILNIRVGALIIRNQRILVSRKLGFPYEWLPGGRIRMQENSEQALWRELKEELGLSMGHARFLCIHENFFIEQTQNCAYHELCFYYLVSVKPDELPDTGMFQFSGTRRYHSYVSLGRYPSTRALRYPTRHPCAPISASG